MQSNDDWQVVSVISYIITLTTMIQVYNGYHVIRCTMLSSWMSRVQTVEVTEMIRLVTHSLQSGFFLMVILQNFEWKSALFALACSRIIIVNMWENQVSLYNSANMGLLKIVFEEHLSLYGNLNRWYVTFIWLLVLDLRFNKSSYQLISVAKNNFHYSSSLQWYFTWKPCPDNHARPQ